MLRYKINVIAALKSAGYNTSRIRREKLLNESQLQNIRENRLLTHKAFDKLCRLLDCQPGDILEYVPDEVAQNGDPL